MTPVKKILHEQEKEDQKDIDTNFQQQQQLIQLKASFQISKVFSFLKSNRKIHF